MTITLPGMFLTKVDRTSMMHSLEVRCPFLDTALAEFAYQLPVEYKMTHHTGKLLLKDLLAEVMPRTFVDRKKQGFGAPVRKWLQTDTMRTYVSQHFSNPTSPLYDHLNRDAVQDFVQTTQAGNDQKSYYQLWVLLCLELWLLKHQN
jgi:asparagine synthase (glutamine-hydrolysing)